MATCLPPSGVFDTWEERRSVAELVEAVVQADYCKHLTTTGFGGCEQFFPPIGGRRDFFDLAVGLHRCKQLASYLKFHNSHVNEQTIESTCLASNPKPMRVLVPDIISHRFGRTEFYEIKPNSQSGIQAGAAKIAWFNVLCTPPPTGAKLPYRAGNTYKPNFNVKLPGSSTLGGGYHIELHIFWALDGLILYELCLVGTRPKHDEKCGALLRAAMLAMTARLRLDLATTQLFVDGLQLFTQSPLQAAVGNPSLLTGEEAPNLFDDVMYVQLMLNDWRGRQDLALIAEDGDFGNETLGAILDFQGAVTGDTDGRIDVGGPAMSTMETDHLAFAFAAGMIPDQDIPALPNDEGIIYPEWDGEDDGGDPTVDQPITPEMDLAACQQEISTYLSLLYFS